MKKKVLLAAAVISIFGLHVSHAQTQDFDPVALEVGGQQIRQSEFMHDYRLSAGDKALKSDLSQAEKSKALREYAELYANFRAKLIDAQSMGLDTTSSLNRELAVYRRDLASPYLIDSVMLSQILHEAYERNRYALHAAHILVKVSLDASPADTLEAYNRIMDYRNRILGGEDFATVATEEVRRLNPRAPFKPNEGELSYFSAFQMVYPFETAAYALQPGEISMPVRTQYGYHIIKLIDRVEMYGKVTLQHIWLRGEDQRSIGRIYDIIMAGTPFENAALQSDDPTSANDGGYIRNASFAQLPHEYVKVLSTLQEGQVSKPFLTRYGWHIVKLVKKDTLPPYESMVPYYRQRMARDQRGEASRKSFAASARKKYGIVDCTVTPVEQKVQKGKKKKAKTQQPAVMMASLDEITSLVNDSLFRGEWRFRDTSIHDLRPLVKVPGHEYTAVDFGHYIRKNQKKTRLTDIDYQVRTMYDAFLDSVSIAYADSQLEKEYPEFADLVDEYRRGLMIFDYNEKMIWTAAINDSAGFAAYYARESATKNIHNPEDSIFFWRTRARVVVLDVADSLALDPAKAVKLMRKALDKNLSSAEMQETLLGKINRKKLRTPAAEPVTVAVEQMEQKGQTLLAPDQWQRGVYTLPSEKGYRILVVQNIIPPCIKTQSEARGYYLSGWQNEYEQNLCRSLRNKYKVKIHYDAINQIRY